jgi:hypothetical protein
VLVALQALDQLAQDLADRLRQNARGGRSADLDLQSAEGVADFGVAPAEVFAGETEDEVADLVGLAGTTGLSALARAVATGLRALAEPGEDGRRPNDLAARLALVRGESLPFDGEPAALPAPCER